MSVGFIPGSDRLEPGRHVADLDDVASAFVAGFPTSTTREPLFSSFVNVRAAIMRVVPVREQWINGSFVTSKVDPADIDLVTVFDGHLLDALDGPAQTLLKGLLHNKWTQALHGCDSYVVPYYPEGDPNRRVYEEAQTYWDGWFGRDREGRPKGYVVVSGDV